jgi:hypothetical protein
LRLLRIDLQQLIGSMRDQEERDRQSKETQERDHNDTANRILATQWQIEEHRQRQQRTNTNLHLLIQGALAVGTWLAFLAAGIYAGIAASQLDEMTRQRDTVARISRSQFRAYVLYEGGKLEISRDGRNYTAYVALKNFGQTPAYNVTHWINAVPVDRPDAPLEIVRKHGVRDTGTNTVDLGLEQSMCIVQKFPAGDSMQNKVVYVWGLIKYRDRYQRCQLDLFELRTEGQIKNGASLVLVNTYNHTTDYMEAKEYHGCPKEPPLKANLSAQKIGIAEDSPDPHPESVVIQGGKCSAPDGQQ